MAVEVSMVKQTTLGSTGYLASTGYLGSTGYPLQYRLLTTEQSTSDDVS